MKKRSLGGKKSSKTTKRKIGKAVESVQKSVSLEPLKPVEPDWKAVLSTGSTLLDLAISGNRIRGGGVPAGILMEVYGRSGSGKTSILSELCASAQSNGGDAMFQDPEARLDKQYSKIYGMKIPKDNYFKPDTVTEMFDNMTNWDPPSGAINVMSADSLAALSTELEMSKGDKMGMRRAKEFSEGLRKYARIIQKRNWIIACSNQVRQGDYGDVTPGGKAVEFYSSLRISINQVAKILKVRKVGAKNKEIKRAVGIESKAVITKSSLDKPYREVPIYIVFDYGIDDIRANLQWYKDYTGSTKYLAVDQEYQQLERAIAYVEGNNMEAELKELVIDLWNEIEEKFTLQRIRKRR